MNIGAIIHRIDSCSSTNDVARELAQKGVKQGTVVISKEQTKGRGTKGRTWFSAKNRGLYTSIVLRPKKLNISVIPLMAGLAVKDSLSKTSKIQVGLCWPNDLVWQGNKLGGILCESAFLGSKLNYVILGIGLNISHGKYDFPEKIRTTATSLKLITENPVDIDILLKILWKTLNYWYQVFCQGQTSKIIRAFEKNSVFAPGERLKLITEDGEVEGIYRGINSFGGLILEEGGRKTSFFSAEIKAVSYT